MNTLRNTANSTVIANSLSNYIDIVAGPNPSLTSNRPLSVQEIDSFLTNISNINLTLSTPNSILVARQPDQGNNVIVLGASFNRDVGGEVVDSTNRDQVLKKNVSTAAVISNTSLIGVKSLNILIINTPTIFETLDNVTNKKLASSVVVASLVAEDSTPRRINISLFFQVLTEYRPNASADYFCSFFDDRAHQWNSSGCTTPRLNAEFDRFECSCDHLTSFALIWLPQSALTNTSSSTLNTQDIASLVFQSLSILCFLAIVVHASITRFTNSSVRLSAYQLLPLISTASTMVLFVFYIALGMTVYTRKPDSTATRCFTSASVLMFFFYFFLIFMFCVKTSVGYFNYLRFVLLFPEPSFRKLLRMLIISFFIAGIWVSFAAGFNSNSSYNINQLYQRKLCWFSSNVIHYFLTIPVCLFLSVSIITLILVARSIITHVRAATTSHESYERMKRCVLVLLSSSVTQGIGWLFGPLISLVNPSAGNVLGWFFVIFNGLEGFWSIILYLIIRTKRLDESKRATFVKETEKAKISIPDKYRKTTIDSSDDGNRATTTTSDRYHEGTEDERSTVFSDLHETRSISWPGDEMTETTHL